MKRCVERLTLFLVSSLLLGGCVGLHEKVPENKMEANNVSESAMSEGEGGEKNVLKELELKQARLWSRIDELEGLVLKNQQRVKILEQALLIDHSSSEKREEKAPTPVQPVERKTRSSVDPSIKQSATNANIRPASPDNSDEHPQSYESKMEIAKKLFAESNWNKAFLAFSEIDRNVEPAVSQGETLYWLARCWFQMKEFPSAKQYFTRFIEMSPNHKLVSSAHLFYAKSELGMGRKNEALTILQDMVKTQPTEENSEIAIQMLKTIKEEGI